MSANDYVSSSRVVGRSVRQIMEMGLELEKTLGPHPSPPPAQAVAPTADVLNIPPVTFARPDPIPFKFDGYPTIPAEEPLLTDGPTRARPTETLVIPPMDEAYIMETSDLLKSYREERRPNAFECYLYAIPDSESDRLIGHVWKILHIMSKHHREGTPLVMNLLIGARQLFEKRFKGHLKETTSSALLRSKNGVDTDAADLYLSFVRSQNQDSLITFMAPNEIAVDRALQKWHVLYVALRSGDFEAAEILARGTVFPTGTLQHSPAHILKTWKRGGGRLPLPMITEVMTLCHGLLTQPSTLTVNDHYLIRTMSFLCGHVATVDKLMATTSARWDSAEEFLWFLLGCVRYLPTVNGEQWIFSLRTFQERIRMYAQRLLEQSEHRSNIYIVALLSSLQFKAALKHLLGQRENHHWYVHGVHLAIALEYMGMLDLGGELDERAFPRTQIAQLLNQYATIFRRSNTVAHFQYHFFANKLGSGSPQSMEEAMKENIAEYLLQDQQRSGLELSSESIQVIKTYGARARYPRHLFRDVAKYLKEKGHLEPAYKCYHAGGFHSHAIATLSQLVATKLGDMISEKINERGERFVENKRHVAVLLDLFKAMRHELAPGASADQSDIRSLCEEVHQLHHVFKMVQAYHSHHFDAVIGYFEKFPYIPSDDRALESCARKLCEKYERHLGILHKLIELFCKALILQARTRNGRRSRDYADQLRLYHLLIKHLPETYSFKGQISSELSKTSRALATI